MQASIYNIVPFDVSIGTTIKFSWTGNQVVKNKCIILDHETNTEVYNNVINSYRLEHTLDLSKINGMVNGKRYVAFITVFDQYGNESDIQTSGRVFLCLKTPIYKFSNVKEGDTLAASSYGFQLNYSQENGELLDSWQITLYDMTNNVLSTSGVKYNTDDLLHTFSGFESKSQYRIRAIGQTVNGMSLDTGYVTFSISYDAPAVFSMLELTNLPKSGAILVHSNIKSADGRLEKEPEVYINGEYIDLSNNTLIYDEGFLFKEDFSLTLYAYNITANVPFFKFYSSENKNFEGAITYRVGRVGSSELIGYLELKISNGTTNYIVNSNQIEAINENTILGFCLTREQGYYDLQIKNLGSYVTKEVS